MRSVKKGTRSDKILATKDKENSENNTPLKDGATRRSARLKNMHKKQSPLVVERSRPGTPVMTLRSGKVKSKEKNVKNTSMLSSVLEERLDKVEEESSKEAQDKPDKETNKSKREGNAEEEEEEVSTAMAVKTTDVVGDSTEGAGAVDVCDVTNFDNLASPMISTEEVIRKIDFDKMGENCCLFSLFFSFLSFWFCFGEFFDFDFVQLSCRCNCCWLLLFL